jgi:purine-nucleoside phosphorylase
MRTSPLQEAARHLLNSIPFRPKLAVVLGSGLGDFADSMDVQFTVENSTIPHYPASSVQGHAGKLIFGTVQDAGVRSLPFVAFKGRVHYYEGGKLEDVLFPIRLAHRLGVRTLLLTNAAGGVNNRFEAGQLMLMRDYINFTGLSIPFEGSAPNPIRKSHQLDRKLQLLFKEAAKDIGVDLKEGTYCWLQGPSYETAGEINMVRVLGADAVGMSTVPEIVKATDLGMKVGGISLISNLATGLSTTKLSHDEVTETANRVKASFAALMKSVILKIR